MKKVLLAVAVVAGASVMTSCKKDYTCTYDLLGVSTTVDYNGLKKAEAETAESACVALSGTWAAK